MAAKIEHPNVVHIYEVGSDNHNHFIAMNLVDGETLADMLKKQYSITPKEAIRITCDICSALSEAHKQRVVHRDIKPLNIMIDKNGHVYVTDFGISLALDSIRLSKSNIMGTPAYMSPERCEGKSGDIRSDIYSLGITLYEMLTGIRPFNADNPVALSLMHIKQPPKPPILINPQIEGWLNNIVLRCLDKNPERRYQTPIDVRNNLREGKITNPAGTVKDIFSVYTYNDNKSSAPLPLWVIGLSAVALCLVIGIAMMLISGGAKEPLPAPPVVIMASPTPVTSTPVQSPTIPPTPAIEVVKKGTLSELKIDLEKQETTPLTDTDPVTGMEFVFVKGGCYQMGDTFGDGKEDEQPAHVVCVNSFYMGIYEVSNSQFKTFVEDTGYQTDAEKENTGHGISDDGMEDIGDHKGISWRYPLWPSDDILKKMNHPVIQVSWNDAKEFISWLNKQSKKNKQSGKTYRLPTEAEWEYACSSGGGGKNKYSWGDNNTPSGNIADESFKKKYPNPKYTILEGYDDGYEYTAPVESYRANKIGLFNMSGNVWEWTEDKYDQNAYSQRSNMDKPIYNPIYKGGSDIDRVIRGGSWFPNYQSARCARRNGQRPTYRSLTLGFRIIKE
ncbi:MAG: SUMF1/EgtB/PvdO family nonheme iron enzyme [Nitrospirae bacterium]|nr:SUMF1/EgtB/PvdO family nonheme iron enzyme [Nitrospirota bacterium]